MKTISPKKQLTLKEMKENIIQKFGYGSKNTIDFFYVCERYPKRYALISYTYHKLMKQSRKG